MFLRVEPLEATCISLRPNGDRTTVVHVPRGDSLTGVALVDIFATLISEDSGDL